MASAFIALGSNLGDREATLRSALRDLNETRGIHLLRFSTFHETEPVGGPPSQSRYLNAAAEIETELAPPALLATLLQIEEKHGRVRGEKDAPRTLDLDILLFEDLVRSDGDPVIPHPRMHERRFVLAPLAEIAPQVRHPVFGKTIEQILNEIESALSSRGETLKGMNALVTGSTSGIGAAIALALKSHGASVIRHGRRLVPGAVAADLRDAEAPAKLVSEVWQRTGGLDVCVLNAGADVLTGDAAKWPFERKLAELLAVDVTATMLMARDVGQRMRQRGRGVILTMSWDQAETGMEGDSGQLFAATKAAIAGFTKSLAKSLAPQVRVNALAPGWIQTKWGSQASDVWHERVRRETPMGRWGTPEDVAAAAVWLCSPAASFITGQVIRVNGGAVV
jgi:2-amino-4-hydroxy-6-hydroxymethyldihydropteridine diphosphokinase